MRTKSSPSHCSFRPPLYSSRLEIPVPCVGKPYNVRRLRERETDRPTGYGLAYTLLEVLVALSVLVIGMAAVFGIGSMARKQAVASADLAAAQLACYSTLNELLAQETPIQTQTAEPLEELPNWKLQVDLQPASRQGLYSLQLTVQKYDSQGDWPAGSLYRLVRWVPTSRVEVGPKPDEINGTELFENPYP